MEDPSLVEYLVQRGVGIEANLTSNIQTSTVPDLAHHPLRTMLERGLLASINTDDPGVSAIDLQYEFEVAAPQAGLTQQQIRQAQLNALDTAFLTQDDKAALRKRSETKI
jgi:adenosine deaminase